MSTPVLTVAAEAPTFPGRAFWEAVADRGVHIELVAMTAADTRPQRRRISEHLLEITVPRTGAHEQIVELWLKRPDATEALALAMHHRHTPAYGEALESSAASASAVVAAGSFAGPALLRHTRAPLVVDARDLVPEPAGDDRRLVFSTALIERRACRAATIVRACSDRHADGLVARHDVDPARIVRVPDGASPHVARFTPYGARRTRIHALGMEGRPLVLAPGLARPHGAANHDTLDELVRALPDMRILRRVEPAELPSVLAVAAAGLVLDQGPGAAGDVITLAQAGVPVVAEPGVLEDAGLRAGDDALAADRADLAVALREIVRRDQATRISAARDRSASFTQASAAEAFLSDARVASLLQWSRPMHRRPRPRNLMVAA